MLTTDYDIRYPRIAYNQLSLTPLAKEDSLCFVFRCSQETLAKWKSDHDEFSDAIKLGLLAGETKLRLAMTKLSLMPSKFINTKLLSILASNVYSINEEHINTVHTDAYMSDHSYEDQLRKRGIPIPTIDIEDIE